MRDHIRAILDYTRNAMGNNHVGTEGLLVHIEVEAMAALHGGKYIIPSKLFGDIDIPQNVITAMSNGEDDMWFSHGCALDVNVFYDGMWLFTINPVKNGDTDTGHLLEHGKL
jgi:hypothetical protein